MRGLMAVFLVILASPALAATIDYSFRFDSCNEYRRFNYPGSIVVGGGPIYQQMLAVCQKQGPDRTKFVPDPRTVWARECVENEIDAIVTFQFNCWEVKSPKRFTFDVPNVKCGKFSDYVQPGSIGVKQLQAGMATRLAESCAGQELRLDENALAAISCVEQRGYSTFVVGYDCQ
jgi:hypothetical protein